MYSFVNSHLVNTYHVTSVHSKKTEHYPCPRNSFKPLLISLITFILISNTLDYVLLFLKFMSGIIH